MQHTPLPFGLLVIALSALSLVACRQMSPAAADAHRDRYAGVGIYAPDAGWARQAAGQGPATAAARIVDDEAVIVVVDSQTGEVRACGDLSGYCVGMNPWRSALARPQQAPVDLVPAQSAGQPAANTADNAAAASR